MDWYRFIILYLLGALIGVLLSRGIRRFFKKRFNTPAQWKYICMLDGCHYEVSSVDLEAIEILADLHKKHIHGKAF